MVLTIIVCTAVVEHGPALRLLYFAPFVAVVVVVSSWIVSVSVFRDDDTKKDW